MADRVRVLYRVQHSATGEGPYHDPFVRDNLRNCWDTQPEPQEEGVRVRRGTDYFAFPSRTHMRRWFDPAERRALRRRGYEVVKVVVPAEAVTVTPTQALFDINRVVDYLPTRW